MHRTHNDTFNLLGHIITQCLQPVVSDVYPSMTVKDTEDAFLVLFAVPGVKREDVSVEIKDGSLLVSGKKGCGEGFADSFKRSVSIPKGVDFDSISATCVDGLLTVRLPKKEAAKARSVPVGA